MTENDNKTSVKSGSGKLDAADLRWCDDVACDANNEEVTEALVEDEFGWNSRIGAPQDDGKRLLGGCQLGATDLAETNEGTGLS